MVGGAGKNMAQTSLFGASTCTLSPVELVATQHKVQYLFTSPFQQPRQAWFLKWWGWKELNFRPTGYEPAALTTELHPRTTAKL